MCSVSNSNYLMLAQLLYTVVVINTGCGKREICAHLNSLARCRGAFGEFLSFVSCGALGYTIKPRRLATSWSHRG